MVHVPAALPAYQLDDGRVIDRVNLTDVVWSIMLHGSSTDRRNLGDYVHSHEVPWWLVRRPDNAFGVIAGHTWIIEAIAITSARTVVDVWKSNTAAPAATVGGPWAVAGHTLTSRVVISPGIYTRFTIEHIDPGAVVMIRGLVWSMPR